MCLIVCDPVKRILIGVTIDEQLQYRQALPQALVARGWEVHLVSEDGQRLRAFADQRGVFVHPMAMRRQPSPAHDLAALISWIRLIRRVRPDVTMIGTPKAALLGNLAAAICRVPRRIHDLLGLRAEIATGLGRSILLALERFTAARATEVLVVGESLRARVIELRIASATKSVVLGHGSADGVDIDRYNRLSADQRGIGTLRGQLDLDPLKPTIGFVGRLARDKGLPELADALKRLRDRGLEVEVLIVGRVDDRSGYLEQLEASGQRIISAGYQFDPAPYYTVMDAFCLPSLREGLPNVVLEAMAAGAVVVASDATGNVDLVRPGSTGYLVPRRSAGELADALEAAVRDIERSERYSAAALAMVAEHFDSRDVRDRILRYLTSSTAS